MGNDLNKTCSKFQMHCFTSEYAANNFTWFTHLENVKYEVMHHKLEELVSRVPGIGHKPQFHVSRFMLN